MMRPQVLGILTLAALPLGVIDASAAQPQNRNRDQREQMRFRGMDANNDGTITQREWRGSAEAFRNHDWNKDGRLSGDEVRPGGQRNRNRDEDDYNQERGRVFDDWTTEGFTYLDHNRDGRLSRDEWHYDRESFIRADRNRDNILSRAEFLSDDNDLDREDRFEDLDGNKNGRIERGEWHGSRDAFAWLDRNNDGVLSRVEILGEEQAEKDADLFASLDYNRDGRLSQDEWHWSRRSFQTQDTNRDGSVSRAEFSNPTTTGAAAPEQPAAGAGRAQVADQVVEVVSNQRWVDSGIDVRAGDVIAIRADGRVRLSTNPDDLAASGGASRTATGAPMPNHPAGSLIARIGNGAPIFVGDSGRIARAPNAGRLYLGVNDDHLADNAGHFRTVVSVRR